MIYLVMDADEVSPEHSEHFIDFGEMPLEKVRRLTDVMADRGSYCTLIARFPSVEFIDTGMAPSQWESWLSPHRFFNYRRRVDRETDKMTYIEVTPIEERFVLFSREELGELLGIFKVNAVDEDEDDCERVAFIKHFENELENR